MPKEPVWEEFLRELSHQYPTGLVKLIPNNKNNWKFPKEVK